MEFCLLDAFRNAAASHPDRPAVVAAGRSLSYGELQARCNVVARVLRANSIGRGSIVTLYVTRSVDVVVAMLGVMTAGAAFTVIEEDGRPLENRAYVLKSLPQLILTSRDHVDYFNKKGYRAFAIDGAIKSLETQACAPAVHVAAADRAYVLYTSGSTGKSKGVCISHASIAHYVVSLLERLEIGEPLSYAHVSALSADLGNTCIFPPLWTGGVIHLIDDDTRRDSTAFFSYLSAKKIDVLKITPSHWNALFRPAGGRSWQLHKLRYLILGGESLSPTLAVATLRSGVAERLVNHYGPTETTIGVAAAVYRDTANLDLVGSSSVTLGRPLGRTTFVVRTEDGQFASSSAKGELYICGPSVGQGYLQDPEATSAAFVDVDGGERAYKTGDVVRLDEQGGLEFLGRVDRQVKIRGHRVELESIESVARRLEGVVNAAALMLKDGIEPTLGLVIQGDKTLSMTTIRAWLAEWLPAHALPTRIVVTSTELPRNTNGKTQLDGLINAFEADDDSPLGGSSEPVDELTQAVTEIWQNCLGHRAFDVWSDFFEVGGDSLQAIRVISELQARGFRISTRAFLEAPTVLGLAAELRSETTDEPESAGTPAVTSYTLASSQRWFFGQQFCQPQHWNQCLLMQASGPVASDILAHALQTLVENHDVLTTAFRLRDGSICPEPARTPWTGFTESTTPTDLDSSGSANILATTARALHSSIDLSKGDIFKVHLFRQQGVPDKLLFIAHHLAIDVVSWHIVLADLAQIYSELNLYGEVRERRATSFWSYVESVQAAGTEVASAPEGNGRNLELRARSVWIEFSKHETYRLNRTIFGVPLHRALLGAFVHALCRRLGSTDVVVDVEGHGRSAAGAMDTSRIVGWFTVVQRFVAAADDRHVGTTIQKVNEALTNAPALGLDAVSVGPDELAPKLCYNFIGTVPVATGHALGLLPLGDHVGPARGDNNERVYDLKLTGRLSDERLIVDLSFAPERDDEEALTAAAEEARQLLLSAVGGSVGSGRIVVEHGSTTGELTYLPPSIRVGAPRETPRAYRSVLLTGATGYIGIHLLHLLLTETNAKVSCLVRDTADQSAGERLRSLYRWYFPREAALSARLVVVKADASEPNYGLGANDYDTLARESDAIFDLAADTRLFGGRHSFQRSNVDAVRNAIALAQSRRPKDLHFVSTLAVSGINPMPRSVRFSESDLNIGQQFTNEYERSKYEAETLVNEFIMAGGRAFIYRAGNVSAHSKTGRFRRDARQNRLVQTIRALVKTRECPIDLGEPFVLSAVDDVARAIIVLSHNGHSASGTFHVDGDRAITLRDFVIELDRLGISLKHSQRPSLAALFGADAFRGDADIALGSYWSGRARRNVQYDNSRTLAQLRGLGVMFTPFDALRVRRFLLHLIEQGALDLVAAKSTDEISAEWTA